MWQEFPEKRGHIFRNAQLGPQEVRAYLVHLVQKRRVSWSLYNQTRCALRFF